MCKAMGKDASTGVVVNTIERFDMAMTERLASSQMTSNLGEVVTGLGDVDYIRAAGMVSQKHPLGMALFRLKYSEVITEAMFCRDGLVDLLIKRRGLTKVKATKAAEKVLIHYLGDRCDHCGGTGYQVIPGTPTLSDNPCPVCKGHGVIKLNSKNDDELWLQSQIALMESDAAGAVMRKLRDAMF